MTRMKKITAAMALLMSTMQLMALNLNTASVEELTNLKGIGAATAAKIVRYRESHRFESVEELKNVKGIGEKKFEKIKSELEV